MATKHGYLILDCYVDEPACFGVPPFIAPYPRYIYGALRDAGVDSAQIEYTTIDQLRAQEFVLSKRYDGVFIVGGAVVPGKYLRARIGTQKEIAHIIERNPKCTFFLGGAIGRKALARACANAKEISGDIEFFAYHFAQGNFFEGERTSFHIAKWSVLGSSIVRNHPEYPHLICEIETYRGCPRQFRCSFCQEFLRKTVSFRTISEILDEIDALIECGISRIRIGCQPDILQYGTKLDEFFDGFSKPNPKIIISLFDALKKRRLDKLQLVNIDNANPGTIARFPNESAEILQAIVDTITPGDTLALGIESFDDAVIRANNLKASPQQAIAAVQLINDIGSKRNGSVPILLPGINLLHGLLGERLDTFKINYEYLMRILEMGLLVKRVNIRTVNQIEGTPLSEKKFHISHTVQNRYEYFRKKIREDFEKVMLAQIYPPGTILRNLRIERQRQGYVYARQIASYPIAVKIPYSFNANGFFDIIVINHQERSVIGLPLPIDINNLPFSALKQIPGVGEKGASHIIFMRPFNNIRDIINSIPSFPQWLVL